MLLIYTISWCWSKYKPATVSIGSRFDQDEIIIRPELAAQLASTIFQGPAVDRIEIGRFTLFNPNCVGDAFQSAGVPTLLIEGTLPNDYSREQTRICVLRYILGLEAIASSNFGNLSVYHSIQRIKRFFDFLLRDVSFWKKASARGCWLQYQEVWKRLHSFSSGFCCCRFIVCHGHIEPNCEKIKK